MKKIIGSLLVIAGLALSSPAWADPLQLSVPCTINHDDWPFLNPSQWAYQVCTAEIPALQPYQSVEVSIGPINQIGPRLYQSDISFACHYATPFYINLAPGFMVSTFTDGTIVRAAVINVRGTASDPTPLTVGIECH